MTRIAKLHAAMLADPRGSWSFREFQRLIVAFGFEHRRTTGSHHQYVRPGMPLVVSVQPRGKDAKSYQIEQFLAICTAHNLELNK